MKTLSIKQYLNQYPRVSAVPSITQSGSLAAVLERIEQRQARQRKRRALRRKVAQRGRALLRALQQRLAYRPEGRGDRARPPRAI